jgi:hypothetical protein
VILGTRGLRAPFFYPSFRTTTDLIVGKSEQLSIPISRLLLERPFMELVMVFLGRAGLVLRFHFERIPSDDRSEPSVLFEPQSSSRITPKLTLLLQEFGVLLNLISLHLVTSLNEKSPVVL